MHLSNGQSNYCRMRSYLVECTGSCQLSEVKWPWARLVLWWGTTREQRGVASVSFFAPIFWPKLTTVLPSALYYRKYQIHYILLLSLYCPSNLNIADTFGNNQGSQPLLYV